MTKNAGKKLPEVNPGFGKKAAHNIVFWLW